LPKSMHKSLTILGAMVIKIWVFKFSVWLKLDLVRDFVIVATSGK